MAKILDHQLVLDALAATGAVLTRIGQTSPVRLLIAGGTAGMLGGSLKPARTTGDCDVMGGVNDCEWEIVAKAAAEVAATFQLPATWLNRDCRMYAWSLPRAWESRCEIVGRFGPLEVLRVSRVDLIAAKIFSSPKRPQDLEDLRDLRPTKEELDFAEQNIDRIESEDLDGTRFGHARTTLSVLRGEL